MAFRPRWTKPREQASSRARVHPYPLTVGVYVDACLAAGIDEGEAWNAETATDDVCFAVLSALAAVTLTGNPEGYAAQIRAAAKAVWADVEAERERAAVLGTRVRLHVEEALGEGLQEKGGVKRYGLLRALSVMAPAERAALCAEPLARALVLGQVGAIEQQAKDATDKAMHDAREAARRN